MVSCNSVSVNNSTLHLHCLIANLEPKISNLFFFTWKRRILQTITFIVNLSLSSTFRSIQKLNSGKTFYKITVLNTFIVYFYTKGNTLTALESKESFDCFSLYVSPKFCRCNLAASLHIKCYVLTNNTYRLIMAPLVKRNYTPVEYRSIGRATIFMSLLVKTGRCRGLRLAI